MTLRADLTALLEDAAIIDVDIDRAVLDEHARYAVYRHVILVATASRSRAGDRALVRALVRDPDGSTARTAVVELVDQVAAKAGGAAEFRRWAEEILPETDQLRTEAFRAFVRRRVLDWLVYLAVGDGRVPSAAELADLTEWMQRLLARTAASQPVLALLAESGGTRRIRNIARSRAGTGSGRMGRRSTPSAP